MALYETEKWKTNETWRMNEVPYRLVLNFDKHRRRPRHLLYIGESRSLKKGLGCKGERSYREAHSASLSYSYVGALIVGKLEERQALCRSHRDKADVRKWHVMTPFNSRLWWIPRSRACRESGDASHGCYLWSGWHVYRWPIFSEDEPVSIMSSKEIWRSFSM